MRLLRLVLLAIPPNQRAASLLVASLFLAGFLISGPASHAAAQETTPLVLRLQIDGPISPAVAEYLSRGIRLAEQRGAELVVIELDTPGGSIDVMTGMVQALRASRVPVVIYVSPRGAIAGSAGTVITLAGHAAAMAPETAIGAASPVGSEGQDLGETLQAKTKNILKAEVRSLAAWRGERATALAESTIEAAQAAAAVEALDAGLIDFIAADTSELLAKLDGFEVQVNERPVILETSYALVEALEPSLIEQLLTILTNPAIVFLLLSIGVQAILIELSSPGGWFAGFLGVVCLALAAYGMGVLSVNWFGGVFIILAFVLFILDIKAPTHGALTIAGVGSLIVAGLVLFNSPGVPSFQRVPPLLIIITSMFTGAIFFLLVMTGLRAQRAPIRMGRESLVGKIGVARQELSPGGIVQLAGEQWSAEIEPGSPPLPAGARVQVIRVEGLRLRVRQADQEKE
jgi:membrane-bound serine protease (ClpP class)